jgi:cytochrome c553
MPDKVLPAHIDEAPLKQVPDSTQTYDHPEIDPFDPPDWFPGEHPPMPPVVRHGAMNPVQACSYCHLASGMGHPQSANLAGLSVDYFIEQIADFKSGARKAPPMDAIAKALSDDDAKQAAAWFAALKPTRWVKVVETDTAPKTLVINTRLRLPLPDGSTEPLGDRIIEVPEFPQRALSYDPHAGFIAYVPMGSIAKGETLVKSGGGGKTLACFLCHGSGFHGSDTAPRIAGRSAIYIVRQLHNIQSGARDGAGVDPMKQVVANLTEQDMIAIAAYISSREP